MKTKLFPFLIVVVLLIAAFPASVFAAEQVEYTIDVRNRTGAPVELNYRGADGIIHWVTVPEGVSSLSLMEGVYSYWADPVCGHIAGDFNLSQQRQILWISCDDLVPSLEVSVPATSAAGSCGSVGMIPAYTWMEGDGDDWFETLNMYPLCPPQAADSYNMVSSFDLVNPYWYTYFADGVANWNVGAYSGWTDFGPGFYYSGQDFTGDPANAAPLYPQ